MQPETVLKLYREHNPGFDIKKEDLFPNGKYCRQNKWNNSTTPGCIMHLIHRNNTLGAQFHLAGQSTVLRIDSQGKPIRESDRLILCSQLGGPTRNSDPHVSSFPTFRSFQATTGSNTPVKYRSESRSTISPMVKRSSPLPTQSVSTSTTSMEITSTRQTTLTSRVSGNGRGARLPIRRKGLMTIGCAQSSRCRRKRATSSVTLRTRTETKSSGVVNWPILSRCDSLDK